MLPGFTATTSIFVRIYHLANLSDFSVGERGTHRN